MLQHPSSHDAPPQPPLTHQSLEAAIATFLFDPASPPLPALAERAHISVFDFLRALAAHPHLPHLIAAATSLRLAAARVTAIAILESTAADAAASTTQRRSAAREILRSSSPLLGQRGVGSGGGRGWTASSPSSFPHALGGPGVPPGTSLPSSSPSPATPPSPLDFSIDPNDSTPLSDAEVQHLTSLVDSLIAVSKSAGAQPASSRRAASSTPASSSESAGPAQAPT